MGTGKTNAKAPSRGAVQQDACEEILPRIRQPAVPVALAFILGILLDRWCGAGGVWMSAAALGLVIGRIAERRGSPRAAALLLLAAWVGLGGLRHHLRWTVMSPQDVSRHASAEPVPAKLIGVLASPPAIRAADRSDITPPWMRIDSSECDLQCERLVGVGGSIPASGRVRLFITGHVLHASVGDRVEVIGQLVKPHGVENPGGFNYGEYLRRSGIRCLLQVEHPDAIRVLEPRVTGRLARLRARVRAQSADVFVNHLDRRSVPLAMSLILGERSLLPHDVREAFAESGTIHLLAISGQHVAILAGLLLGVCRLLNVSIRATAIVLVLGVASYAVMTHHQPPVVRAGVLAALVAAGWPWFRRAGGANLIAVCALVVLLINPADLFETGTQLSFLSVVAIGWAVMQISRWRGDPWQPEWRRWLFDGHPGMSRSLLRYVFEGYVITAAICLFTMPLIAYQFHIVAPVGFLVNVLLLPVVAVVLGLGFLTLFCGLLAPWIVSLPAIAFDASLNALQSIVDASAHVHLGHAFVAGPAGWWLVGFYAWLAAALAIGTNRQRHPVSPMMERTVGECRLRHRVSERLFTTWMSSRSRRRWLWRGVAGWVIVGLVLSLFPRQREGLRCTFLAVGHGCAVVLELPGGETLLYDAGSFGSARRGQTIIQNSLWERGVTAVDAVIVSHADIDHFNAAAGLMQTVPVGTLFCGRTFLDFTQEPVAVLCETASREGVPIRLLQQADRLRLRRGEVELSLLHPPPRWSSEKDNANSLVLRVRYAGRTLLLTGDLEGDGLDKLLLQPTEPVDLLLSPHHGSVKANPSALNRWASPRYVVISGGEAESAEVLRGVYSQAERVLSTHDCGAITAHITPDGAMTVHPWTAAE